MTRNREGSVRFWPLLKGLWGVLLLSGAMACASSPARVASDADAVAAEPQSVAQRTTIRGISFSPEGTATRVRLESDRPLEYELSSSQVPPQAVLLLSNVTLEQLPAEVEVGDGTLDRISLRALPGGSGSVTLDLAAASEVRAEAVEGGLDLYVDKPAPVVKAAASEIPTVSAGVKNVRLLPAGSGVGFDFGAAPSELSAFLLSDGRRLVVDAEGVDLGQAQISEEFADGPVSQVRMGRQENRVRAVVESREAGVFENYRLVKTDTGFQLLLGGSPTVAVMTVGVGSEMSSSQPSAKSGVTPAVSQPLTGGGQVEDFGFRQDERQSYVDLALTVAAPHEVVETGPERVVLDLLKTALPQKFQRAMDTSAFPGPVRMVAAYPSGENTRIVVALHEAAPFRVEREGAKISLAFAGGAGAALMSQPAAPIEEEIVIVGSPQDGSSVPAGAPGTAQKVYTGQRLSMDFVDADIRNVLRLIGDVSGLNIIAGDDVQGRLTIRLIDVPWDQAFDVILKTRGLDQVREHNVVRIAPADRLAQEKARALEQAKAQEELEPLVTDIIPVSYATAQEISAQVTSVLSERGSVTVDARTNALLVKDVAQGLVEARRLVKSLDTQTPQVLIEARIVEVGSTLARDLGIQWGGGYKADAAHGNATDWAFPNSIGISGDTGVENFAVNFPSSGGAGGPGGALALSLGHINDILTLDLRLSAIENSGRGRVISAPRVTTLDNRTAEISQGVEIPFTTTTDTEIETQSIDYKLVLNVTPHVTADRSIIMKITVTKDAPSTTYVAVDTKTPAKETRQANTEVLVRDGETAVIGGIITETKSESESGIPWLRDIPGIGWLFKSQNKQEDKTELIIFITPKIVNSQPLTQSL